MSEELLKKMSELVDQLSRPAIPVERDLWDSAIIAAYLKRSERQVMNRLAPLPSFPKAIRLPVVGGGKSHPLWKAKEIIAWAEKHQDKKAA